jgi:hypothetical protein
MSLESFKATRQAQSKAGTKGLIWQSILIEFDYVTGEAKVLRCFSKPAIDSKIKGIMKKFDKTDGIKIHNEVGTSEDLFNN